MCGIVGTVRFRGSVDQELLLKQRDTMIHRGPDSAGVWVSSDGRVGFGHRRLAIIDLTPAGHQPMVDAVTGSVITFNGEIYNYVALRDRLIALGHRFHTESDTEVILAAYREWGEQCVAQLSGMFAFALFDESKRRVFIARDRAGEKPLFYRSTASEFSFASEAKALIEDPSCPRRVRAASLNEYLAYGYVTGENTMFADISKLLPGSAVSIDLASGKSTHARYWELPLQVDADSTLSPEEAVDELQELLENSVRRQLVADVPVGVLLSGGVDSSIIAAIAAKVGGKRIRTFTARFPERTGFDEGPFARMVADHLGTDHVEIETPPASTELLMKLVAQFDNPIADSSMIPTFLISQEIRRHATVALGGDGGDELFGGYFRYPMLVRHEQLRRQIPSWARSLAATVAPYCIPQGLPGRGFLSGLAGDTGAGIANAGRVFRDDERATLSPPLARFAKMELMAPEAIRARGRMQASSALQRATGIDFSTYMVDDILAKVDRASMLSSLEVRAPFLDHAIIDFAFSSLPDSLRATETSRKVILRMLGKRILPASLDLTRKQGFSIPVDHWMRGPWRSVLDDVIALDKSYTVSTSAIKGYRDALTKGRSVGERLFALMFLRLWEERFNISDVV